MDDVSEYIQLEEQRKEREALRQSMGDVFAFGLSQKPIYFSLC